MQSSFSKLENSLMRVLERAHAEKVFPGGCLIVGARGLPQIRRSIGTHTFEVGSPQVTENSLFDLASITKWVVAMMIHALIQKKKVRLTSRVSDFFAHYEITLELGRLTLLELMTHQVVFDFPEVFKELRGLAKVREVLLSPTRKGFRYGNICYLVLGEIVQRICRKDLQRAFEELIGGPLGISDFHWWSYLSEEDHQRVVPTEPNVSETRPHDPLTRHVAEGYGKPNLCGVSGAFASASAIASIAQSVLLGGLSLSGDRQVFPPNIGYLLGLNQVGEIERVFAQSDDRTKPITGNPEFAAGADLLPRKYTEHRIMNRSAFVAGGFTGGGLFCCPTRAVYMLLLTNSVFPHSEKSRFTIKDVRRWLWRKIGQWDAVTPW